MHARAFFAACIRYYLSVHELNLDRISRQVSDVLIKAAVTINPYEVSDILLRVGNILIVYLSIDTSFNFDSNFTINYIHYLYFNYLKRQALSIFIQYCPMLTKCYESKQRVSSYLAMNYIKPSGMNASNTNSTW